jgi:hypothetical protein
MYTREIHEKIQDLLKSYIDKIKILRQNNSVIDINTLIPYKNDLMKIENDYHITLSRIKDKIEQIIDEYNTDMK